MTGQTGPDVTVTTTQEPPPGLELDLVATLLLLVMGILALGTPHKLTTVSNNVSIFIFHGFLSNEIKMLSFYFYQII